MEKHIVTGTEGSRTHHMTHRQNVLNLTVHRSLYFRSSGHQFFRQIFQQSETELPIDRDYESRDNMHQNLPNSGHVILLFLEYKFKTRGKKSLNCKFVKQIDKRTSGLAFKDPCISKQLKDTI
ncbi:Uncharacterized protein Fot_00771 [Forsythia ovata]|uniref:Uncharacterized protein n=1 Tax=Forsythia ovata TaxID=205694 RepID=A0ABD1X222_9LAMI